MVLDEIQKIPKWSETVKRLWDEDTAAHSAMRVVVLGSAPLLLQSGPADSLAGRFEVIPVTHWSFPEMQEAFGLSLEEYIYYGGYPGGAALIGDMERWMSYIVESLIETTVSRDVLLMTRVDKPALLRRLFELGCSYSGRVLSYHKMMGQLHDAGNATTLAHYLSLLEGAGLLTGLQKYAGEAFRRRRSSPKLLALNTALMTALSQYSFEEARRETEYWGRLVETSVGATLVNGLRGKRGEVYYWASGNSEVDFVLCRAKMVVTLEVKSGRKRDALSGMKEFSGKHKVGRQLLVGQDGIPLEEFMLTPPEEWLAR